MRLFVAIPLPDEVKRHMVELQGEVQGVRWVPTEQMHLTLRFLGDTGEATLQRLCDELVAVAFAPFTFDAAGTGCFPSRKKPRVLWAGVSAGEELTRLQHEIEQRVQALGFEPENKPFHPHITLGRCKAADPGHVSRFLDRNRDRQLGSVAVTSFSLFSSTLGRQGARHTELRVFEAWKEERPGQGNES